jgi:hypothetical protein
MAILMKSIETTELSKRVQVAFADEFKEVIHSDLSGGDIVIFDDFYSAHQNNFLCSIPDYSEHMEITIVSPDAVDINSCPSVNYADMTQNEKDTIDNFKALAESL